MIMGESVNSLKLTFSPLKMDGWNTFSFPIGDAYFQGLLPLVSGRVNPTKKNPSVKAPNLVIKAADRATAALAIWDFVAPPPHRA